MCHISSTVPSTIITNVSIAFTQFENTILQHEEENYLIAFLLVYGIQKKV